MPLRGAVAAATGAEPCLAQSGETMSISRVKNTSTVVSRFRRVGWHDMIFLPRRSTHHRLFRGFEHASVFESENKPSPERPLCTSKDMEQVFKGRRKISTDLVVLCSTSTKENISSDFIAEEGWNSPRLKW